MTPAPALQDLIAAVQQDSLDASPLAQLQTAAGLMGDVNAVADAALGYFVDQARIAGHSWSEIGDALGVSKQAAQQRHQRAEAGLNASFERFTDRARRVVAACEFAARDLGHSYIGTEHVLLALYSEPQGIAAVILKEGGLTAKKARYAVTAIVPAGGGHPRGQLPYTPRTIQVFSGALGAALQLGHNYIGTEHLLLGLVRGDGVAATVLREADLGPERILGAVTAKLTALQAASAGAPKTGSHRGAPAASAKKAGSVKKAGKRRRTT